MNELLFIFQASWSRIFIVCILLFNMGMFAWLRVRPHCLTKGEATTVPSLFLLINFVSHFLTYFIHSSYVYILYLGLFSIRVSFTKPVLQHNYHGSFRSNQPISGVWPTSRCGPCVYKDQMSATEERYFNPRPGQIHLWSTMQLTWVLSAR